MSHEVVLVYAYVQKPVADAACAVLESQGIRCWIAPRDVPIGTESSAASSAAIQAGRLVVLILTSQHGPSPLSAQELEQMTRAGIPLLPFHISVDSPDAQEVSPHWIDVLTLDLKEQLEHVADTIKLLLARTRPQPHAEGEMKLLPPFPIAGAAQQPAPSTEHTSETAQQPAPPIVYAPETAQQPADSTEDAPESALPSPILPEPPVASMELPTEAFWSLTAADPGATATAMTTSQDASTSVSEPIDRVDFPTSSTSEPEDTSTSISEPLALPLERSPVEIAAIETISPAAAEATAFTGSEDNTPAPRVVESLSGSSHIPINVVAESGGNYRVTLSVLPKTRQRPLIFAPVQGPAQRHQPPRAWPPWMRAAIAAGTTVALVIALVLGYPQFQRHLQHQQRNRFLVAAAATGDTAAVRDLLSRGADVDAKDHDGNTALIAAAIRGKTDTMQVLLGHGADVDANDGGGTPAVTVAEMLSQPDAVTLLVNHGANLDARDKDGMTLLMRAVFNGDTRTVQTVLTRSPNLSARDNRGNTALKWATATGHNEIVALLNQAGARQ